MSLDSIRVNELAKKLNLTSKQILERCASLLISAKTHSSTITVDQARRIEEYVPGNLNTEIKKPKAFIVKKTKVESKSEEEIEKEEIKKPRVEFVKPITNRLEIVRQAPRILVEKKIIEEKSSKFSPQRRDEGLPKRDFRNVEERRPRPTNDLGEFRKTVSSSVKSSTEKPKAETVIVEHGDKKQPIQRHIIPQDIYTNKGGIKRKSDKKKDKTFTSKEEEQERISLEKAAAQKHKKRQQRDEIIEQVTKVVVNQAMTISELSEKIQKTPAEIVKFLMMQGVMATVNQLIDVDTIKKVCVEFELEVLDEDVEAFLEEEIEKEEKAKALQAVDKKLLKLRAPVVSIMGHVDHGKTTLLDSIRASKHKIVATEVGGITQSIGAYTVHVDKKKVVFIDTPGHEAFTEMRARGAKATDIAILVVAAGEGIMPQTV
jgi:translation initiation factor IF-2